MMKYKVYISQVWSYTAEIEVDSRAEAEDYDRWFVEV